MLLNLSLKGIGVSSGSACTSRALKASHVLLAMNIDPALASAIFVTTATDVFGFFIFLGLAKTFLYYLR